MTGIVFGCFIPLHSGHANLIRKATSECDRVVVVSCGHKNDRGENFIPFEDREPLVKEHLAITGALSKCAVCTVDDEKIHPDKDYSHVSWKGWLREFFKSSGISENEPLVWYTGEQSYAEDIARLRPNDSFVLADRSEIPISGTMIRENPKEYESRISIPYRKYLRNKGILR